MRGVRCGRGSSRFCCRTGRGSPAIYRNRSAGRRRRREPDSAVGRVPRISRLMALALKCERLMEEGSIASSAELARLGHVSRARISQILNLLHLAPAIQESLLFLPGTVAGRDRVTEKRVRDIARVVDWERQRAMFRVLMGELDRGGAA